MKLDGLIYLSILALNIVIVFQIIQIKNEISVGAYVNGANTGKFASKSDVLELKTILEREFGDHDKARETTSEEIIRHINENHDDSKITLETLMKTDCYNSDPPNPLCLPKFSEEMILEMKSKQTEQNSM